jgi:hypothetical protein
MLPPLYQRPRGAEDFPPREFSVLLKILVKAHLYLSGILPLDGAHLDRSVESDDLDLDPLSAIRVAECPRKSAGVLDWLPGAAGASPAASRMTTGGSSDRRFSTTQLRAGNGSSCPTPAIP